MEPDVSRRPAADPLAQELASAKEKFRGLWMQKVELEQQLDLEVDLREILRTATFSCETRNFSSIISAQVKSFTENHTKGVWTQYEALCRELRNLQQQLAGGTDAKSSAEAEIENLHLDNAALSAEIDDLITKLSAFDDHEIHQLRAQKQHIELLRRKSR
jgi:chromosome segregation ATPase